MERTEYYESTDAGMLSFFLGLTQLFILEQIAQQHGASMLQLEHDFTGQDYSLNLKALNPSPVDGSGIFIGSYLQSVTKNLALGTECLFQRGGPMEIPTAPSYLAKYTSDDKSWIASAQLQSMGMAQATYWQKISEKVEAAADLQIMTANGKREAIATLGAKYDLRMATFRAQLDSSGKVSAMLEQRFAPTFAFMVAGEIDHFKVRNASHVDEFNSHIFIPFSECCKNWCWCYDREL